MRCADDWARRDGMVRKGWIGRSSRRRRLAGLLVAGVVLAQLCLGQGVAQAGQPSAGLLRNPHCLAPPGTGEDWKAWLAGLEAYRQEVRRQMRGGAGFDDTLYRRGDQDWMTRNFVCGFLFIYDKSFWDPVQRTYRIEALCEEARREFGGYDSVILWHAYPRLGADERNQFDFFRDMPGGLEGVRQVVHRFHAQGVKVFLPYNPWDRGTRREPRSDTEALAWIVKTLDADGLFMDTMAGSMSGLQEALDAARPGVAIEPESAPTIEEIQRCTGSWGQGLHAFPGFGVLHLKWIEQRHMQHQINRWAKSHRQELAAAWLNGSGILVWENIFGSWNPWNAQDRAWLRRMAPVWRHFSAMFSSGQWLPCYPVAAEKVYASAWRQGAVRLWTLVNEQDQPGQSVTLEIDHQPGEQFFDLWTGTALTAQQQGNRCRLTIPLDRFGCVVAIGAAEANAEAFKALLAQQRRETARLVPAPSDDPHVKALPVVHPHPAPQVKPWTAAEAQKKGLVAVEGGQATFQVRHIQRECGCYPDPDTPPHQWEHFLWGNSARMLEHRVRVTLEPFWIQPRPVTNGQFEEFLKATGYRPVCADNFLKHWGGPTCPPELRDKPVVYVDLADARAYAAWAGLRLPTEWEWQQAAQKLGDAFDRSEVWEWTESQRDDGHTRFVMLRGGCRYQAKGSDAYFPGGPQPIDSHAKYILLDSGLDRSSTVGFRCMAPQAR